MATARNRLVIVTRGLEAVDAYARHIAAIIAGVAITLTDDLLDIHRPWVAHLRCPGFLWSRWWASYSDEQHRVVVDDGCRWTGFAGTDSRPDVSCGCAVVDDRTQSPLRPRAFTGVTESGFGQPAYWRWGSQFCISSSTQPTGLLLD